LHKLAKPPGGVLQSLKLFDRQSHSAEHSTATTNVMT
jgi:hypothetical protein